MRKLNWPTLLCHRLVVENDHIVGYRLRVREQKLKIVVNSIFHQLRTNSAWPPGPGSGGGGT